MNKELPRNDDGTLISYAWPGGYPVYYLDKENSVLCPTCANKSEVDNADFPSFLPVACGVNYEDASLYCDDCSCRIESAYAEDDASAEETPESFEAFCGDDAGQYLVCIDPSRQFPLYGVLCVYDGEVDPIGEFPTAGEALEYLNETGSFGWEGLTCQLWQDTGRLTREGHQA